MKEQENNLVPEEQVKEPSVEEIKEAPDGNTVEQGLNEELENIAELFRTELAKAQNETAKDDEENNNDAENCGETVVKEIVIKENIVKEKHHYQNMEGSYAQYTPCRNVGRCWI